MNPRHPLVDRLAQVSAGADVCPDTVEGWESEPGDAVLFFGGDPVRFPEALDVAVVLPELRRSLGGGWRVGIVPREVEDEMARRYAVQRWPSLVFLRNGGYLGTVSGMKDWPVFVDAVRAVLGSTPGQRPAPVIAIRNGDGAGKHC